MVPALERMCQDLTGTFDHFARPLGCAFADIRAALHAALAHSFRALHGVERGHVAGSLADTGRGIAYASGCAFASVSGSAAVLAGGTLAVVLRLRLVRGIAVLGLNAQAKG